MPKSTHTALLAIAMPMLALPQSATAADKGPVQVWFALSPSEVSDKLAILCADRNATVIEQDDRHVLCQREVGGGKGILAQVFLGNSSSTSPQLTIRFSILRDGKSVRVQASQWVELQMAGGQVRKMDLRNQKQDAQLQDLLIAQGAHNVPPEFIEPAPAPAPAPVTPSPTPVGDQP